MQIIAFGHRSRMGKDTAAKFLQTQIKTCDELRKRRVKTIGFATKLKDLAHQLYAWAGVKDGQYYENHPEDREKIIPALGMTVVELWIKVGDGQREICPDVWVNFVTETKHDCDVLIVTDARYRESEITKLRACGAWLYKVHKPGTPYRDSPADNSMEGHDEMWDEVLLNDGDLGKFHDLIDSKIMTRLKAKYAAS